MTADDYGRQAAWEQAHAASAAEAAERVRQRDAAMAANVDPDTMEAFERLVEQKMAEYAEHGLPDAPPLPNPLSPYVVNWSEFWAADFEDNEWLLEPILADGRAHALYAQAKAGKSFLILAAVAALASGKPFLHHPGGTPTHVLYVDYEMTPQDVRERLEEFGYGPSDDLSHLHYALLPSLPPLDTEDGGDALLAAAKSYTARFVVIDTMSRAIKGEENDADTFKDFYRHTGSKLKQAGIGWLRLDHSGKDASKGQRGSSAKDADVDIVMRLERTDGGQRIIATHRRISWFGERSDIAVTTTDGVTSFTLPNGIMWPEGTKACAADLERIGVPVGASKRDARKFMADHGVTAANDVLLKALKWRKLEAEKAAVEAIEHMADDFIERHSADGPPTDHPYPQGYPQGTDHGRTTPETPETSHGPPTDRTDHLADADTDHPASLRSGLRGSSVTPAGDVDPFNPDGEDW